MRIRDLTVIGAAALALSAQSVRAGPCSSDIDRLQARVDARITAVIDTARFAREARRAFGLPVPAPGSLASAESARRDATWIGEAVAAMVRAQQADRDGDAAACARALADAQRAIGP